MGFFKNMKKLSSEVKRGIEIQREIRKKEKAEERKYQQELKQKIIQAKRQSYEAEAIKQARVSAQRKAKMRYNPPMADPLNQQKQQKDFNKLLWDL